MPGPDASEPLPEATQASQVDGKCGVAVLESCLILIRFSMRMSKCQMQTEDGGASGQGGTVCPDVDLEFCCTQSIPQDPRMGLMMQSEWKTPKSIDYFVSSCFTVPLASRWMCQCHCRDVQSCNRNGFADSVKMHFGGSWLLPASFLLMQAFKTWQGKLTRFCVCHACSWQLLQHSVCSVAFTTA